MSRSRAASVALLMILSMPAAMFVMARRALHEVTGLIPGDEIPRASLQHLDGHWETTQSWLGEPFCVVLFHGGCLACQSEIRTLFHIRLTNPDLADLAVHLISLDSPMEARTFALQSGTPFPIFTDPSGEFLHKTRKLVVPTVYYFDEKGRVGHARTGTLSQPIEEALLLDHVLGTDR